MTSRNNYSNPISEFPLPVPGTGTHFNDMEIKKRGMLTKRKRSIVIKMDDNGIIKEDHITDENNE